MNDMSRVIIPDSTQINADELQAGPITIKIAGVKIKGGKEQPVDVIIEGMEKVYRPCKSMCRLMVAAWGADSKQYVGRSMTLYCDPKIKWGGMEVGGLRISHMSDIADDMTMALTVSRSNKKPFTVRPLVATPNAPAPKPVQSASPSDASVAGATITDAQEGVILDLLSAAGMELRQVLRSKTFGPLKALKDLPASRYDELCAELKAAK